MSEEWFLGSPPSIFTFLIIVFLGILALLLIEVLDIGFKKLRELFERAIYALFGGSPKRASKRWEGREQGNPILVLIVLVIFAISIIFLPVIEIYKIVFIVIGVAFVFAFVMKKVFVEKSFTQSSNKPSTPTVLDSSEPTTNRKSGALRVITWRGLTNEMKRTKVFYFPDNSAAHLFNRGWNILWATPNRKKSFNPVKCRLKIHDAKTDRVLKTIDLGLGDSAYYHSKLWGSMYLTIEVSGYDGEWMVRITYFDCSAEAPIEIKGEFEKD
jgi:hypothetical protein